VIGGRGSPRSPRASFKPVPLIALAAILWSAPAAAQSPGRLELGGGARWSGSIPFGDVAAPETMFGGGTRDLFKSSTSLDQSTGAEARIGIRLTSLLQVEGTVALNRVDLTTHITGDAEGVADTMAAEQVTQYAFEGGALVPFARPGGSRLTPFAAGGAGYVRQVHEGRALVDTGLSYYVGGGVKYLLTSGGTGKVKATGLRGDLRAVFTSSDIAPDDKFRTAPSISGSFFVRF
jgi:outer membrane protein with beta-barrel domain